MSSPLPRALALALLGLLLFPSAVYAKNPYRAVSSASRMGFSISHLTNRAQGAFAKFEGELRFNKAQPDASSITMSVDVASLDTKNSARDKALRGAEYFDTASHPKMTFQSKAFRKVGDDRYMVTGPLVIKGRSKDISVPVRLTKTGLTWATGEQVLRFQGSFSIDRTEFDVGGKSALLGSEVEIVLDLEFRAAP